MNELILSASSISSYLACPRRWYLGHVVRLPEQQNLSAAIGTATHAGVEALHRGKPPQTAQEAAGASFTEEAASVPASEITADPAAPSDPLKMLAVYQKKVLPVFAPDLVETPFTIRLPGLPGVMLTGTLDAAKTDEDIVSDLKTTDSKRFNPLSYVMQMTIYACGYFGLTGRWPKRLQLWVLTRKGTARQYEITPDYGELRNAIEIVRDGISRADWSPSGAAAGKCKFCPYRNSCSFSTEREANA